MADLHYQTAGLAQAASHALAAADLARACGAELQWVVELVEVGVLRVDAPASPEQWSFRSSDLRSALAVRRLQMQFEVGIDAAALIVELQDEIRRLKSAMHARGLSDL